MVCAEYKRVRYGLYGVQQFPAWLCRQGQRYPGAVWTTGATAGAGNDGELGPQAASRKA